MPIVNIMVTREGSTSESGSVSTEQKARLIKGVSELLLEVNNRPDECCGFGGTFSVFEEVVSTKMGYDKVRHAQAGAEYMMHQQGCAERIGVPMKFIHVAEILNGVSA